MSTGQRAFAQKLNKRGAAEVRRQVSSAYVPDFPKSISGASLSSAAQNVPLGEVVEPPDFEDHLAQHQMVSAERDAMHHLLDYPADDVEVQMLRRQVRTIAPVIPDHDAEQDPHIRDCVNCYTSDYTVVNRRYQNRFANLHLDLATDHDTTLKANIKQEYEVDTDTGQEQDAAARQAALSMVDMPRGSWASSIFDLKSSTADKLLHRLFDRVSNEEMDRRNATERQNDRQDEIYELYPIQAQEDIIERRKSYKVPSEHFGHRILISCLELKLELEIEPIFASLALYDAHSKKKISENFYFDLTPKPLKQLLHKHVSFEDESTLSRSCIFSITHPSRDIFIVVKLEKVLQQGDISEVAEPYMKDEKNKEKVKANARYACEKLGRYRMPFAWTAIYLTNVVNGLSGYEVAAERETGRADSLDRKSVLVSPSERRTSGGSSTGLGGGSGSFFRHGSLERGNSGGSQRATSLADKRTSWSPDDQPPLDLEHFVAGTLTVNSFFKQEADKLSDDDLYKFLADMKRPMSIFKRLKCIPGTLKLEVSPAPEELPFCLTPELYKIDPYPNEEKGIAPTKEIVEFPSKELYQPHHTYRNILYVYPKFLNFTNRQGSARNIAVKVQFINENEPKPVIFGKSSCPEYTREAYTTVTYHSKTPMFYEEIKLRLPARLTDQHHLLFTFYHISCQKKAEATQTETPIGYTWLPLLRDRSLCVGEYCLPVALEKPQSYSMLHPDVQLPNVKFVDGHKGLFHVSLHAVSSIHTLDEHLDRFLTACRDAEAQKLPSHMKELQFEEELKASIMCLTKAKPGPTVQFLTLLMNKLLCMLVRPPVINGHLVNVGQVIFEAISNLVSYVDDIVTPSSLSGMSASNSEATRNHLLSTYIQYTCVLPHPEHFQPSPTQPGTYSTLGRPQSLSLKKSGPHRSNSDPDLAGSNPGSPDQEVASIVSAGKVIDRSGSLRQDAAHYLPKTHSRKLVHEQLALQWVVSNGKSKEMALRNAWFLLELMIKAMAEHLARTDKLHEGRVGRFPHHFCEDVSSLVVLMTKEIVERYLQDPHFVSRLNKSLAFFINDCLSLMDRGFVYQLIQHYYKELSAKISQLTDATTLCSLKLDYLRILCSHEHYITLNLPFGIPLSSSQSSSPCPSVSSNTSQTSFTSSSAGFGLGSERGGSSAGGERGVCVELTNEYRMQHFLCGLVLADLSTALDTNSMLLHNKSINVVRNLLSSHDLDPRFRDPEVRSRVACLYLPLLGVVLDNLHQLYNPATEHRSSGIDQSVANAIAGSAVYGRITQKSYSQSRRTTLYQDDTRNLLSCVMWLVKNVDESILRQWWSELSTSRLQDILDVLHITLSNFEYKGKNAQRTMTSQAIKRSADMKHKLEAAILGGGNARTEMMRRKQSSGLLQDLSGGIGGASGGAAHGDTASAGGASPAGGVGLGGISTSSVGSGLGGTPLGVTVGGGGMGSTRLRWRKDQTHWRTSSAEAADSLTPKTQRRLFGEIRNSKRRDPGFNSYIPQYPSTLDREAVSQVEGSLAAEVTMIVLDTLELIISIVQNSDSLHSILGSVLRVLLHSLALNQSVTVLHSIFATQRSIVAKFPELLFEEDTEQCADLCLRLLRHCSSAITHTRSQASASLYLLMRQNYIIGNNFARVKMQVTMSLSSLVGQQHNFNEEYLRKSLKTILTYSEADNDLKDTSFPKQVCELVFNLHMILSDTVKMKAFEEDPEMLIDLMYRIAKGYQNSPDLRLTWLQNMAAKHSERGNRAESAQCLIHAAGLVAEYLNMIEDRPHLPIGCVAFSHISCNVLEESAVSDDVVSPDEEGICSGKYFQESGLVGLMEQAARAFDMGGLYEVVNDVYKVLIPIHEHNREYKKLVSIHVKIQDAFQNVIKQEGKRMFGTYFRVGFYGPHFGDLDSEEFIYKEPPITKLLEISHRLQSFYGQRFGHSMLEIIKDSKTVERDKLDKEKAYIQITYVEPYFDLYEMNKRQTLFERNYNIRRFMYATPFTMDGRAHGGLNEQYKRKTILTTSHAFPYVKTRLIVIDRKYVILSPIEVAIEDIQKKTRELRTALEQEPPDPKMLQMVLQGCIGTTVNQGPLEVAKVFLKRVSLGEEKPTKHHNKLRISFKDFLKKCKDSLNRNHSLIGIDQKEYQRELERNYRDIQAELTSLISPTVTTLRKAKHKRDKDGSKKSRSRHREH